MTTLIVPANVPQSSVPMEIQVPSGPKTSGGMTSFKPKDDTSKEPDYELMMGDEFPG